MTIRDGRCMAYKLVKVSLASCMYNVEDKLLRNVRRHNWSETDDEVGASNGRVADDTPATCRLKLRSSLVLSKEGKKNKKKRQKRKETDGELFFFFFFFKPQFAMAETGRSWFRNGHHLHVLPSPTGMLSLSPPHRAPASIRTQRTDCTVSLSVDCRDGLLIARRGWFESLMTLPPCTP